jgi:hypothetical protein
MLCKVFSRSERELNRLNPTESKALLDRVKRIEFIIKKVTEFYLNFFRYLKQWQAIKVKIEKDENLQ